MRAAVVPGFGQPLAGVNDAIAEVLGGRARARLVLEP